jgi:glycosyltransferase involved in cell wall biosynthesis
VSEASRIAVVATVLNEQESIDEWLAGLSLQSRQPDEIIIVDGGSSDGTWQRLEAWASDQRISLIRRFGANISEGRNTAIAAATAQLVAVTDAGTRADPEWLERLVAPFASPEVDVVAGFFVPALDRRWSRALAATTMPDASEINQHTFQPSSRSVAFRRDWYAAGVRYPEWLDYCEDLVWDLALRRAGARFAVALDARVTFRVRASLPAFLRQYFVYARGDGKAGLFARRHVLRYGTYSALIVVLARRRPLESAITAIAGVLYVRRPVQRLIMRDRAAGRSCSESLALIPLVAVLRGLGDFAKMAGYPFGLWWRLRRYGALGWKTGWKRLSPEGRPWQPRRASRGTPQPPSSPCVESPADLS